jgi:hypothetical protein
MSTRRSVHSPGSPDSLSGPKTSANPDGATPAELPSKPSSLHDAAPKGKLASNKRQTIAPAPESPHSPQKIEKS